MKLSAILFLIFFPLVAPAKPGLESVMRTNQNLRGERVMDVIVRGAALPPSAREKFEVLRGKLFNPSALRSALLWVHENGEEALVEVSLEQKRGGVVLYVDVTRRSRISKIIFQGNNVVTSNVLLSQIALREGIDFDKDALEEAKSKITVFYSRQGYLATNVEANFDAKQSALTISISEGAPTLLRSLEFPPLRTIEKVEIRNRYERELRESFGLKIGDRIERDRVLEGLQSVKDWLRERDFLMASEPTLEYRVDESGEVGLFVNVQYGPRIRFGFRGNTHFSYRELSLLVGEVKEVSSGSDYLTAVRKRVLEAYREIGFQNAQITSLVREDSNFGIRYISLIVAEGKKVPMNEVSIEGIYSMPKKEAREKFLSLSSRLVQRGFFHEQGINQAAELFADYLKSKGYLSARLEFVKITFSEKKDRATISVLFNEGVQTKLNSLVINGVRSFSREDVLKILAVTEGQPFDIFSFEKGLVQLKEKYKEIGNLSAQIVNEASEGFVKYSKDNQTVDISLEVEEGPVFRVGEIIVKGNQKTHARVVTRELPFIAGDVLTAPLIGEAEDNIRKLNLFSSVIVRPIDRPGREDLKDILILIEEGTPGSFDIVPGFRNDLGLRLGFEFGYQNLGGWNRSVNARAVFNRRLENRAGRIRYTEYNFSMGFVEPYLANWPVTFSSNVSLFKRQFPSFDANVNRFTVGLKRDLTSTISSVLEYSFEKVKIANANPISTYDNSTDLIGSITPGIVLDSRKDAFDQPNRFNPTKGVHSVNRFEVASQFFGSESNVGYYRFTTTNSAYFRLIDDIVLATAGNFGWERSNVAREPIPPFKLFRLGGLGSIRALPEDALEVQTRKNINGILGFVNYRAELRIPISGNLGTALFWDAGNLMVDRYSLRPERLRSSVGTGLRYNTPVGPVVLDFAWRLQSDEKVGDTVLTEAGNSRFRVHFSIGVF